MICDRLKEERERLGMTQPVFAAAAGAAKRTLIEWEKGATSPSAVQLLALQGIGVDVVYVLTGEREYREQETQGRFIDRMQAINATSVIVDALPLSDPARAGLKGCLTGDPVIDGTAIADALARHRPQIAVASYGAPPVISHAVHESKPQTLSLNEDEALLIARYRTSPKVLREAVLRMLASEVDLP